MKRTVQRSMLLVLSIGVSGLGACKSKSSQAPTGEPTKGSTASTAPVKASAPAKCSEKNLAACRKACEAKDVAACAEAGRILTWGINATKDSMAARQFTDKACTGGNLKGCRIAGIGKLWGIGGFAKDPPAGFAQLEKTCAAGDKASCGEVAECYSRGRGVKKDVAKGHALLTKACESNEPTACAALAYSYWSAKGKKRDYAKAFALYQKSCQLKSSRGCGGLADSYYEGKGVAKDRAQAHRLYLESCSTGSKIACFVTGRHFRDGDGTAKDVVQAKAYFDKSCKMGNQDACHERKAMDKPKAKKFSGVCNATSWHAVCGGKCVDTYRNSRHCGACGRRCPAKTRCHHGARCANAYGGYVSTL